MNHPLVLHYFIHSLLLLLDLPMAPIGSLLWRSVRVYQIYGANTEVGKTIFTTVLCSAAKNRYKDEVTAYLKPVSTGPQDEADALCMPPSPSDLIFLLR